VDAVDLNQVGMNWQGAPNAWTGGDFDASGSVDAGDLNLLGINWQKMIPMPAAAELVPEPATWCLLGLGIGCFILGYRKRRMPSRDA
jgi:hypothetical protein